MLAEELTLDHPMVTSFRNAGDRDVGVFCDWLEEQDADLLTVAMLFRGTPDRDFYDGVSIRVLAEYLRRKGHPNESMWIRGLTAVSNPRGDISFIPAGVNERVTPADFYAADRATKRINLPDKQLSTQVWFARVNLLTLDDPFAEGVIAHRVGCAYSGDPFDPHIEIPGEANLWVALKELIFSLGVFAGFRVKTTADVGLTQVQLFRGGTLELFGRKLEEFNKSYPVRSQFDWETQRIIIEQDLPLCCAFPRGVLYNYPRHESWFELSMKMRDLR